MRMSKGQTKIKSVLSKKKHNEKQKEKEIEREREKKVKIVYHQRAISLSFSVL